MECAKTPSQATVPFKYQNIRTPLPPLIPLTLVTRLGKPTNFFSLHYRVSKNGGGGDFSVRTLATVEATV